MSTSDDSSRRADPGDLKHLPWQTLLARVAIWGVFLGILYLARDFFFLGFMTFLSTYLALSAVDFGMKKLSPDRERPGIRRLLTLGVFVLGPLILLIVGTLVMPHLIVQCRHLAGWLSRTNPETEVARLVETYVGPAEFRREFGDAQDERYRRAIDEFSKSGARYVSEYLEFPKLEDRIEGGFSRQFAETQRGRIRSHLISEGTSSKDFEEWFRTKKFARSQAEASGVDQEKSGQSGESSSQAPSAMPADAEEYLQRARRDSTALAALRQEWLDDSLNRALVVAHSSPEFLEHFREHYNSLRQKSPESVPYKFEQFVELQKVRPQGPVAFGDALEQMHLVSASDREARLRADFEAAKKHELFQAWWSTNGLAKLIRHQIESDMSGQSSARVEQVLSSLLKFPVDLGTALLLSFFICLDFPALQRAGRRLRDTWLRGVYDEVVPALSSLGLLVGRAMRAQGLIALCNATVIFLALVILGVEHAVLLAGAVFVLCLVPTLGMLIAWALIAAIALIQPGGGIVLALKASGAVVLVVLLETFLFSPRILGGVMELHPVLIIAILPFAHYFFGIWGLILAVPVSVYVINEVILRHGAQDKER